MDYKKDDLVTHTIFGFGKVTKFDEKENIQVDFGRQGVKWLSLKYAKLQKLSAEEYETQQKNYNKQYESWPDSTFFHESEDKEHFFSNRWDVFVENQTELLNQLPELFNKACTASGYGDFYISPLKPPANWQIGIQRNYPNQDDGLSVLCAIRPDGNFVTNFFPFYSHGSQINLKLQRVDVWNTGLEAQITANWGDASICFFDTRFLHDRAWYVVDRNYEFLLTGIVYFACPSKLGDVKFKHSPDVMTKLREFAVEHPELEDISEEISFANVAMFMQLDGHDIDDYKFHAPIKSVEPFEHILGQKGWKIIATVMRNIEHDVNDADLKMMITELAWKNDEPPQVGQYIEGALWLQGCLWNVEKKEAF